MIAIAWFLFIIFFPYNIVMLRLCLSPLTNTRLIGCFLGFLNCGHSLYLQVARLQEQLQKERDKRKVLEAELNTSKGPLQVPVTIDENVSSPFH